MNFFQPETIKVCWCISVWWLYSLLYPQQLRQSHKSIALRTAGIVCELIQYLSDPMQILSSVLLINDMHAFERSHKPGLLEWSALSWQVKLATMNCKCCFRSFFNEIHWVLGPKIFHLPSPNETFHQDYTPISTASLLFFIIVPHERHI